MAEDDINFLPPADAEEERGKKGRKFLRFLFIIACLTAGWHIARALMPFNAPNDPLAYDRVTLEPKKPESFLKRVAVAVFSKEKKLAGADDDRVNILLLGMGGPGHDGPYLTDTIMIASLKPSRRQIALISIPRDLLVNIPGHGWDKINMADSVGEMKKPGWGAAGTAEVVEKTFDLPVHYYARVDFKAFEEVVDEVGGLTVSVDRPFTDQMYPAPGDEYQTISFDKGTQTMDGKTALMFARSRHGSNGEGSDFARARRQQKILAALKQKLLSFDTYANPVRVHDLLQSLDAHVTTNMEFSDMMALIKIIRDWGTGSMAAMVLDNGPAGLLRDSYTARGAYVLEPKDGDFENISLAIQNVFDADGVAQSSAPTQETAPKPASATRAAVEIQNGTWSVGLAARMKKRLEDKSFAIAKIGNTAERPQASSGIYKMRQGSWDVTMQALQDELHIPIKEAPPDHVTSSPSTDILIVLGTDTQE